GAPAAGAQPTAAGGQPAPAGGSTGGFTAKGLGLA
ncbi:MAG: hypothetical protein JWM98_2093, partial [Thermoleophilia bacterium]|nr:hypothetical protein [Thermoleophilia bacterium]